MIQVTNVGHIFYEGLFYTSVEVVGLESIWVARFSMKTLATVGGFEGAWALFGLKIIQLTFVVDFSPLLCVTDWLQQLQKKNTL